MTKHLLALILSISAFSCAAFDARIAGVIREDKAQREAGIKTREFEKKWGCNRIISHADTKTLELAVDDADDACLIKAEPYTAFPRVVFLANSVKPNVYQIYIRRDSSNALNSIQGSIRFAESSNEQPVKLKKMDPIPSDWYFEPTKPQWKLLTEKAAKITLTTAGEKSTLTTDATVFKDMEMAVQRWSEIKKDSEALTAIEEKK